MKSNWWTGTFSGRWLSLDLQRQLDENRRKKRDEHGGDSRSNRSPKSNSSLGRCQLDGSRQRTFASPSPQIGAMVTAAADAQRIFTVTTSHIHSCISLTYIDTTAEKETHVASVVLCTQHQELELRTLSWSTCFETSGNGRHSNYKIERAKIPAVVKQHFAWIFDRPYALPNCLSQARTTSKLSEFAINRCSSFDSSNG